MKGWEPTVSWNRFGKAAVPTDKSYVPTGVTTEADFPYDPRKTVPSPPSTWKELLSSKWNGEIGMNDPA